MKKNIYFFSIIAMSTMLMLSSCKKSFLDSTSASTEDIEDAWQTESDAYKGLVSIYNILDLSGFGYSLFNSELASDNAYGAGSTADISAHDIDLFVDYNDVNSPEWTGDYKGIYRANLLFKYIDNCDFTSDPDLKTQYIGEAKFLRAYFYFNLVRMFGNIQLVTEPIEDANYNIAQADPDSVYALITNDLIESITDLSSSAQTYANQSTDDYGRVTKWAAESLLARVYLFYTGYYSKSDLVGIVTKSQVISYLDDVINNSGYGLVDDFSTLFRSSALTKGTTFAGQNNKEGVFVIQYSYLGYGDWSQNNGNRTQVLVGLRGTAPDPYHFGWGLGTVPAALWNSYASDDIVRRNASIIGVSAQNLDYTEASDQYQYTGYFWKKFSPLTVDGPTTLGGDYQIDNYDNYPVIRFADVLLMSSELNLDVDLGKAQTYFNQVRSRAFGDSKHIITLTDDDDGLNTIYNERKWEFAFEGIRYFDVIRRGMDYASEQFDDASQSITFPVATKGLFSIPETQISLSNGYLTQNAGW